MYDRSGQPPTRATKSNKKVETTSKSCVKRSEQGVAITVLFTAIMFKYVLIPAVESEPISSYSASKAGGLSDDALSKNAKAYFFEKSGGAARALALENATPEDKKMLAQKIRDQYASSPAASQLKALTDDAIVNLLKTQEASASCEITCLTVPTPLNNHKAVSMYGDDNARTNDSPFNPRATSLMRACGHSFPADSTNEDGKPSGIFGDVFIGRCHDNEMDDIWEREDINPDEVEGDVSKIDWCKAAKKKGGGGGCGGSAASLSNTLQNISKQQSGQAAPAAVPSLGEVTGESSENGYKWIQNDEECELRFSVAPGTKAKYVKVKFGLKTLKVTLAGQTICDGETWGNVSVDDSTFTIQDDPDGKGRELCVSLGKKNEGETWNFAVSPK